MFISYDKLWTMLAEKKITKTELCEIAGLSTRTIANMTKNKDVSLGTLGKICTALHCEVADVVTFSDKQIVNSVYEAWLASSPASENDMCRYYSVIYDEKEYDIAVTKRTANKFSVIKCLYNSVLWTQMPFSAGATGMGYGEALPQLEIEIQPRREGVIRAIVISGKPNSIWGLDEGIFRSSRNPGDDKAVHVMSMTAFKLFQTN